LLFTWQAGVWLQHCLWQQAPRVRVAAARATTAAILVMVMVMFRLLSRQVAVSALWYLRPIPGTKEKPDPPKEARL